MYRRACLCYSNTTKVQGGPGFVQLPIVFPDLNQSSTYCPACLCKFFFCFYKVQVDATIDNTRMSVT